MKLNLQNDTDIKQAKEYFNKLLNLGKQIDLKEVIITRTSAQNKSLHLYYTIISNELNELGLEFTYKGIKGVEICTRYTPELVKDFIWRPIQIALFDIKSTTKINTKQINEIVDVLAKFFGEKGITLQFPSIESLLTAYKENKTK